MSPPIERIFPDKKIPKGTRFVLSEDGAKVYSSFKTGDVFVANGKDSLGMGSSDAPWLSSEEKPYCGNYFPTDGDYFTTILDENGNVIAPDSSKEK